MQSKSALVLILAAAAACASDTAPSAPSKLAAPSAPSLITNGAVDANNTYSNVGAFVIRQKSDGEVFQLCSGTLIAPTVFLTAGHCTAFFASLPANGFSAGVNFANPLAFGTLTDPHATVIAAVSVITNPEYNHTGSDPADMGVLIVSASDTKGIPIATLPTAGLLDRLQSAHAPKDAVFTAVGYGEGARILGDGHTNFENPNPDPRQFAFSSFNALDPAFIRLSENPSTGNGGTCFGDSGGPNFLSVQGVQILAATTIEGDPNCRSTNVDFRLDTPTARRFLQQYVTLP